jgi:hypothetical protein
MTTKEVAVPFNIDATPSNRIKNAKLRAERERYWVRPRRSPRGHKTTRAHEIERLRFLLPKLCEGFFILHRGGASTESQERDTSSRNYRRPTRATATAAQTKYGKIACLLDAEPGLAGPNYASDASVVKNLCIGAPKQLLNSEPLRNV